MQPKIQNGWQYNVRKLFGLIDQNVGAKAGTGVSVTEQSGALKKTVLELDDVSVTMTDAAANGSQGSLKIYDFPAGNIVFVAATTDLTISRVGTAITATAAVVGGVGTAVADLGPSTTATLTAGAGTFKGKSLTAGIAVFDGTTTAKDAYLNFAIPDAGSTGNDALLVNGTITILWADSGDN
jgi:hypothetical protein